MKDYIFN